MNADPAGWRYGLLGLPLAFVALPLYVQLPARYAMDFGVPLAALGGVLLGARVFDAFIDPWIGRLADRAFARSVPTVLVTGAGAAGLLALGFALLAWPGVRGTNALLAWVAGALALTMVAFSMLTVAHQAWGAMQGGDEAQRARITGWREGFGLAGVLLASVLPTVAGWGATAAVLSIALAAGCAAWASAPWPPVRPAGQDTEPRVRVQAGSEPHGTLGHTSAQSSLAQSSTAQSSLAQSSPAQSSPAQSSPAQSSLAQPAPLRHPAFRRLLAVFVLNGIASALPATLLLFFMQDRLQLARTSEPVFLGAYFLAAALSMPLWLRVVRRLGLAGSWRAGMLLSVAAFAGAASLGPGDGAWFLVVCIASGLALGSDLACPAALLAGVVADAGERGKGEGAFFGWWNLASKLNLALAAGVALPLLEFAGYAPGERSPVAMNALVFAYCILPCALKLGAAVLLHFLIIRPETHHANWQPNRGDGARRTGAGGLRQP